MSPCFSNSELVAFLAERLPESRSDEVARHLDDCATCQERAESLCEDAALRQWCRSLRRGAAAPVAESTAPSAFLAQQLLAACPSPAAALSLGTRGEPRSGEPVPPGHRNSDSPPLPRKFGQYELLASLGHGGMGVVYRALHRPLGRIVALKLLPDERLFDPLAVARFHREMQSIGRMQHPHIVQAYDAGEIDGRHYLAMEFIDGCDLEALAGHRGTLSIPDACEAVRQAAVALAHAHAHGLVHRDVKPSNLLVSSEGVVKLADLGLARLSGETNVEIVTATGNVVGTADYLAPEQAAGNADLDSHSDMYNLGCVLFRLLVGRPPFHGERYDTALKKLFGHVRDEPPRIERIRDDIPHELAELVHRLLAKNPDDRPECAEVVDRLSRYVPGADLAARVADRHLRTAVLADHATLSSAAEISLLSTARQKGDTAAPTTTSPTEKSHRITPRRRLALFTAALATSVFGVLALVAPWQRGTPPARLVQANLAVGSTPGNRSSDVDEIPKAVAEPQVYEDLAPGEAIKDVWYSLLNREPQALVWPGGRGATRHFEPAFHRLTVHTAAGSALLSLGSVEADDYTLQVEFHQSRWTGGIGIFFGGKEEVNARGVAGWKCQRIYLTPVIHPEASFQLLRSVTVAARDVKGRPAGWNDDLAGAGIRTIEREPQTLEITVRKGALHRVRWNGREMPELTTSELNSGFTPADYQGYFGTIHYSSDCIVSNPRIMIHSAEGMKQPPRTVP